MGERPIRVGDYVKVDRPRSQHHGREGVVTWIGLDQFKSTPQRFVYAVKFDDRVVPYDYLLLRTDGGMTKPDPIDPEEGT